MLAILREMQQCTLAPFVANFTRYIVYRRVQSVLQQNTWFLSILQSFLALCCSATAKLLNIVQHLAHSDLKWLDITATAQPNKTTAAHLQVRQ